MECLSIPEQKGKNFFQNLIDRSPNQRLPISGSLEITMRCNLRCVHCYLGENRFTQKNNELTTVEIFRIIDELVDAGCLWLLITGGETFLRPDLFDVLGYTRKKGIIVSLFSNGTMLTEENVKKLADCPPQSFEITVYGYSQATYEKVTGIPGSHARFLAGLELLKKHNIPVQLKSVFMKANLHEFSDIRKFALGYGSEFRFDGFLAQAIDGSDHPIRQRISVEEVVQLDATDPERIKEYTARASRTVDQYPVSPTIFSCGAGLRSFHINSFGMLSPCIFTRGVSYNLREGPFCEGWDGILFKARSQTSSNNTRCSTCSVRHMCHKCPGYSYLERNDLEAPVEYLCQLAHHRANTYSEIVKGEGK